MKQKIGFLGLGIMGAAMSLNVAKAGYPLKVYNRTPKKVPALTGLGVEAAASPRSLAEDADVVVAMVTGPEALDSLLWGKDGAGEALKAGKTFINMSTVPPDYSRDLAGKIESRGADFIDAPVSGSKKPAEDATLLILAGGKKEIVDARTPLLLTMGKKVVYCGEAGRGSMMKMANNLLLGALMEGFAEALNFGKRAGLSMDALLEVLIGGPLGCPLFQMKVPNFTRNEYPPAFPLKHMTKDLKFLVDTAYELGAPIPAGSLLLGLYRLGVAKNWGDLDVSAIAKVIDLMNGVE